MENEQKDIKTEDTAQISQIGVPGQVTENLPVLANGMAEAGLEAEEG